MHGFRSTFRDWSVECTNTIPTRFVKSRLRMSIDNKAEAAYRRGDLFDKRRRLMNGWAEYCESGRLLDRSDANSRRKNGVKLR